jgi:hypothetical protein
MLRKLDQLYAFDPEMFEDVVEWLREPKTDWRRKLSTFEATRKSHQRSRRDIDKARLLADFVAADAMAGKSLSAREWAKAEAPRRRPLRSPERLRQAIREAETRSGNDEDFRRLVLSLANDTLREAKAGVRIAWQP